MARQIETIAHHFLTRRELLQRCGTGFGALALTSLLADDVSSTPHSAFRAPHSDGPLAPKRPHFAPKIKRVVHLFMNGGPSQVDTFDPKPQLNQYDGKPLPIHRKTERKTGVAFGSPYKFQKHGQSGIEVSELYPHTAKHVDDLCVIRSMHTDLPNHEPSLLLMNCGDARQLRPSLGSWLLYRMSPEHRANRRVEIKIISGGTK